MKPTDAALGIAVTLVWSLGFVFAKATIEQFPPILLMAFRFGITAFTLIWFVPPPTRHQFKLIGWAALVSATIQYALTFTGLKNLDASVAIIIVQLEVPFAALFAAIFFKDILGWRRAFGMILSFIGVALIAGQPEVQAEIVPLLMVVGGAATWALGQVMIKKIGPIGPFSLIAWIALFAAPQLLLCSWLFEHDQIEAVASAGWSVWGVVIYLSLVMTALGYAMWYHLLRRYDVNQVLPFLLLLPVFTVAGSIVILGETLSMIVVLGGAIAVAGVAIIMLQPSRSPPP